MGKKITSLELLGLKIFKFKDANFLRMRYTLKREQIDNEIYYEVIDILDWLDNEISRKKREIRMLRGHKKKLKKYGGL